MIFNSGCDAVPLFLPSTPTFQTCAVPHYGSCNGIKNKYTLILIGSIHKIAVDSGDGS